MDRSEAMAALGTVGEAKAALARAADCPPWRHAAFGGLMGMLVLAQGVTTPYNFALIALSALSGVIIYRSDRKRMGVFVNGYRKGATRPLTFVLLGVMLVIGWSEIAAKANGLSITTRIALAVIAALLATAMSVQWQRIFRRELGVA